MLKVYDIDDKNTNLFNDNIAKSNSFLKVYHPMCGHCIAMKEDWDNFTGDLKKNYDGKLNLFNIHADALPHLDKRYTGTIQGFPTIKLFTENGGEVEYTGDRSESDLLNFCKKYVTLSEKPKYDKTSKRVKSKMGGGAKRKTKKKTKRKTKRKNKRKLVFS